MLDLRNQQKAATANEASEVRDANEASKVREPFESNWELSDELDDEDLMAVAGGLLGGGGLGVGLGLGLSL